MNTRKAYFFTNEKLASFLATEHFTNVNHVFGIGGGDFAFNLIALQTPKKIVLCDNNPLAISAAQMKIDLMKHASYEKFLRFLSSADLREIKKSKHYFSDSFKAAAHIKEYLTYLSSQETYLSLQKAISKIEMVQGDFATELSQQTEPFDLIYLSNLLETKSCREPNHVLNVCRTHLSSQGKSYLQAKTLPKTYNASSQKISFTKSHLNATHSAPSRPSWDTTRILFISVNQYISDSSTPTILTSHQIHDVMKVQVNPSPTARSSSFCDSGVGEFLFVARSVHSSLTI